MNAQNRVQRILLGTNFRSNDLTTLNQENFDRIMFESLHKAIDSPEKYPVKEKHVRKLLIGSFQAGGGVFFWKHLPVIRLKEEMLVCWKFCYVLHKMLRDGPQQMVKDSNEHKKILIDCGNMWRYVGDIYGKLIYRYCSLLYNRINFLMRNPSFPNDLRMSEELIANIDINVMFDFCCEVFDALQDVEKLVMKALDAFEKQRLSSATNSGKCLLAPLVACVQDASLLYDYCIKMMFRLHTTLENASLDGHRDRFSQIHQDFYWVFKRTRDLQYFRTLLQIPHVSIKTPDFLVASDIQRHSDASRVTVIQQSRADSNEDLDDQPLVDVTNVDELSSTSNYAQESTNLNPDPFELAAQSDHIRPTDLIDDPFSPNQLRSGLDDTNESSNKDQTEEYIKTISQLESKVDELTELFEQEQQSRAISETEMQSKIDALDKNYRDKVQELECEIKKLKDESVNLKSQLTNTKTALAKAHEERDKADHNDEISQLAVRKMAEDMSQLKKEVENSRRANCNTKNVTDESVRIIDELTKKNESLSLQLSERDTECRELRRERELLNLRKDQLEQQLDTNQSNLMMAEMIETDRIIKEATNRIEELSEKSRMSETGIKLQVNEKISEVCTNLMKAVRNLMVQSDLLQREIVGAHGMTNNVEDFYKRNSSWTEGLISAAKIVAMAAKSLVDSADRAMSGEGKYSELAAAAHEIATATTQLVVASRVKANKDSEKLKMLTIVAKQVNQCRANIFDTARICADLIEKETDKEFDVSALSLHQTKKLEMEAQVKLLELENAISKERIKLGLLRRRHYEQEAQNGDSLGTVS